MQQHGQNITHNFPSSRIQCVSQMNFSEVARYLQPILVIHWQWQVHFSPEKINLCFTFEKLCSIPDFRFADIPGEDGHTRNSSTTSQTGSAGYSSSQSSHGTTAQVSFFVNTRWLWSRSLLMKSVKLTPFPTAAWPPIKAQQWWLEYTAKVTWALSCDHLIIYFYVT